MAKQGNFFHFELLKIEALYYNFYITDPEKLEYSLKLNISFCENEICHSIKISSKITIKPILLCIKKSSPKNFNHNEVAQFRRPLVSGIISTEGNHFLGPLIPYFKSSLKWIIFWLRILSVLYDNYPEIQMTFYTMTFLSAFSI